MSDILMELVAGRGFVMTSRPLAKAVGVDAALLFGELCSRQVEYGPGFYAAKEQLTDSTAMSAYRVRNAEKVLKEVGAISVERRGTPARNYYEVNRSFVNGFFGLGWQLSCSEIEQQEVKKFDDLTSRNLTTCHQVFSPPNTVLKTSSKNERKNEEPPIAPHDEPGDGIPYGEIVAYLNERSGKAFRETSAATRSLVRARWREGFRLDDFRRVIDTKCAEWGRDPKMAEYVRPSTLFGTKFESYLNQGPVHGARSGGDWSAYD